MTICSCVYIYIIRIYIYIHTENNICMSMKPCSLIPGKPHPTLRDLGLGFRNEVPCMTTNSSSCIGCSSSAHCHHHARRCSFLCCLSFGAVACSGPRVLCLRKIGRIPHFRNSALPALLHNKSQIEAFHVHKPTRKRIFTISYSPKSAKYDRRPKKTFFQSHFSLLKH